MTKGDASRIQSSQVRFPLLSFELDSGICSDIFVFLSRPSPVTTLALVLLPREPSPLETATRTLRPTPSPTTVSSQKPASKHRLDTTYDLMGYGLQRLERIW